MNEAVYESGMPRVQEVTPPEVEVTDDTGTVIEQLTNTATQLDGTEDVLEQLDVLDKESTSSVGAAPTIATDAGTVTAVLITPSAYALVADADTRLGTASVVAVGQHQDARLEAAQKAIDEELSLHPTVFQKSNNSGVNSAGFRHVKLLTNRGNCFQASLSQTSDRAACGMDPSVQLQKKPPSTSLAAFVTSRRSPRRACRRSPQLPFSRQQAKSWDFSSRTMTPSMALQKSPAGKQGEGFLSSRRASV